MHWLEYLHEGRGEWDISGRKTEWAKVMRHETVCMVCSLDFRGFPVAGKLVQRMEHGRMGWKCDGRLKSRQELGHGGAGIGIPCHGVWVYSEDSENPLTVSKKIDQVRDQSVPSMKR